MAVSPRKVMRVVGASAPTLPTGFARSAADNLYFASVVASLLTETACTYLLPLS